ncbi:hypothetical protein CVP05_03605, partial [Conservatibacter flavescens]
KIKLSIAAQQLSGQEFNMTEFAGAVTSGAVSPIFKTSAEVVRFNMGVGMATGLANGSDGLSEAALSGVAAYGSSKAPNKVLSTITGEAIQKLPNIRDSIIRSNNSDDSNYMKRIFLIFFTTFISFNIGALILNLKDFGIHWNIDLILKIHYAASIYALKCGAIGVVVDWFSKDWFDKKDK